MKNPREKKDLIEAACKLLGPQFQSPEATRLLLSIGLQETGFATEFQQPGPARGWWQFEHGGGVKAVARHAATKPHLGRLVRLLGEWPSNPDHMYDRTEDGPTIVEDHLFERLDNDEVLAAGMARLLLWPHPKPIPQAMDPAWHYYLDQWRPGKPHRGRWTDNWVQAGEIMDVM